MLSVIGVIGGALGRTMYVRVWDHARQRERVLSVGRAQSLGLHVPAP